MSFNDQLKGLMDNHYAALDKISSDSQGMDATVQIMENIRKSTRRPTAAMSSILKTADALKHEASRKKEQTQNVQTYSNAVSSIWEPKM